MQKHIVDEKTGIPYTLVGEYYLPWGELPYDESEEKTIGVWGNRRKAYLKKHHRVIYYNLLTSGKLYEHLANVEEQSEKLFSNLVKEIAEKESVTEQLKTDNAMAWVQRMNNIRNRATEFVNNEIVFH